MNLYIYETFQDDAEYVVDIDTPLGLESFDEHGISLRFERGDIGGYVTLSLEEWGELVETVLEHLYQKMESGL